MKRISSLLTCLAFSPVPLQPGAAHVGSPPVPLSMAPSDRFCRASTLTSRRCPCMAAPSPSASARTARHPNGLPATSHARSSRPAGPKPSRYSRATTQQPITSQDEATPPNDGGADQTQLSSPAEQPSSPHSKTPKMRGARRALAATFRRSHLVSEVPGVVNETVQLSGWLQNVRRMGKTGCFGMLRDHSGLVQVFAQGALGERLASLPVESAVSIVGKVTQRPSNSVNRELPTGQVEVQVSDVPFSNKSVSGMPFAVGDATAGEELRLKHRFLDLRSPRLQHNLRARAEVAHAVRACLREQAFLEVETPYLFRPTPEGAKEYLVRTRWPSMYYSLPQSPQQYKQLLMMGGFDRYFQIARCFRDEDMRTERQPEFTQVDFEMAFSNEEDVMAVAEDVVNAACRSLDGSGSKIVFQKMQYHTAMRLYGSDKPDLRIAQKIESVVSGAAASSPFRFVKRLPLCSATSREAVVAQLSANAQLVAFVGGKWEGSGLCFTSEGRALADTKEAAIYMGGDNEMAMCETLGKVRLAVNPVPPSRKHERHWLWVTHFPMFEKSDDGWKAAHHPFTAPLAEDEALVRAGGSAAFHARARSYDMVLNGVELGGGSVRIHDAALQLASLNLVGVSAEKAHATLGHLLSALSMGAPPHAGLAFGLDRLMMQMLDMPSLKDVIAFPKAADGKELMVGSPAHVVFSD